jgi:hypothetical protein
MNPLLLLATRLLPDLAGVMVMAGDQSGTVEKKVVEAVKTATGADTLDLAQTKVDEDTQVRAGLQKTLADIALEESKEQNRAKEQAQQFDLDFERLKTDERERIREEEFQQYLSDLQDRQEARAANTRLAEEHNPLAWVAPSWHSRWCS